MEYDCMAPNFALDVVIANLEEPMRKTARHPTSNPLSKFIVLRHSERLMTVGRDFLRGFFTRWHKPSWMRVKFRNFNTR